MTLVLRLNLGAHPIIKSSCLQRAARRQSRSRILYRLLEPNHLSQQRLAAATIVGTRHASGGGCRLWSG